MEKSAKNKESKNAFKKTEITIWNEIKLVKQDDDKKKQNLRKKIKCKRIKKINARKRKK